MNCCGGEKAEQVEGKALKPGMMKSSMFFHQHFRVTSMVALITIASVGLFGYGGYRLDLATGLAPLFLVIGLVVSFPFSQLVIYRWIKTRFIPFLKERQHTHG